MINTVQCGGMAETTPVWQQIATTGGGTFAAISQDGGMLALATPMDDELSRLNADSPARSFPTARRPSRPSSRRSATAPRARSPSAVASRLGFLSKLGGKLNSGRADLLDAISSGDKKLADVPSRSCRLAGAMAPAEREEFVKGKLEERKQIQTRIDHLSRSATPTSRRRAQRRAAEGRTPASTRRCATPCASRPPRQVSPTEKSVDGGIRLSAPPALRS